MKKSRLKTGALILLTMITVGLLMPLSSYGQGGRTDGFFSNCDSDYDNRDAGTPVSGGITNDAFGTAPLGNGLMIMSAACAGYLLLKKRRRTIGTLMMVVIMLTMTQCKKCNYAVHDDNQCVSITLNVDNNTKVDVNTINGAVKFVDGDEIIVANSGRYKGTLIYGDGVFSGSITNPVTTDYLHFYYLGNIDVNLTVGTSTTCSINISDQINSLPVISYGCSTEKYSTGIGAYEAHLENKCALVKFNVTSDSPYAATCITGMNNKVDINFGNNTFIYGMENDGKICLPTGSGERWAILFPQSALGDGAAGSAFAGRYKGHRNAMPEINADDYLDAGVDVVMDGLTRPEGALKGLFTVNADGKQVMLAKANLAYVLASNEWKFLDNQYDIIETINVGTDYQYGRVDAVTLFEWGQTGYNHGAVSYMPYDTQGEQGKLYAYGDPACNLYDQTGQADWGYVFITNGGKAYKQWRTLTVDEWNYLFTQRNGASSKYGRATINNNKGIVVLPDDWVQPEGISFTAGESAAFGTNNYSVSEWSEMESRGAAFLPCAGYRFNSDIYSANTFGRVWSSTAKNDGEKCYAVTFTKSAFNFRRELQRYQGTSVRLVCE